LSITSIPKVPTGLTAPGRALWRSVLTDYWMDGESHKLAILEQACKVTDRIAEHRGGAGVCRGDRCRSPEGGRGRAG
jgi:hypothetical protein